MNSITLNKSGRLPKQLQMQLFELIVSSVLRFKQRSAILELCKEYRLSDRQIDKYIQKARKLIASRPQNNIDELIAQHITAREQLYRDCSDDRTKLAILDSIKQLQGLDTKIVEVKHTHIKQDTDKLIEIAINEGE